jgi:hypothetical protein
MKKSELLDLLETDIIDAAGDLELQARMVLARCLSVGMLPPPDDLEVVTGNIVYAYYYEKVVSSGEVNKNFDRPNISKLWSPENEKK